MATQSRDLGTEETEGDKTVPFIEVATAVRNTLCKRRELAAVKTIDSRRQNQ